MVDHYSGYVMAKPCKSTGTKEFLEWMCDELWDKDVEMFHSDNGAAFTSKLMDDFSKTMLARQVHSRPYRPRELELLQIILYYFYALTKVSYQIV